MGPRPGGSELKMESLPEGLPGPGRSSSKVAASGVAAALALLSAVSVRAQPIPPLPELSLETYEAGLRAPLTEAYRSARQQPQDAERNGRLGMILYANEQYELAAPCFERAHGLSADDARWAYYLGRAQVYLARSDLAAASLRTALRLRPGDLPARLMLAKSLLDGGHSEESRGMYRALVNEYPAAAEAHYGLGLIDAASGDFASAVEHFQKACEIFPAFGAAHFALARAYRDRGEKEKAQAQLALYQKDKLGWPSVPDPLLAAILELKTGANARLRKGIELAEAGESRAAALEHEQALLADPKLVRAHVNLIRLYGTLGQPEKAAEHFRAAIAVDPNLAEAHYNYGVLLTGQGQSAEAKSAFLRALELNPAYAEAHHNYAYLLMTSGELEDAAQHYRAALESKPDHRMAHFNLGRILVQQGRILEAIEHFRKTLDPEDEETPRCTYALGAAYARAGNRGEALKYMREAQQKATARGQSDLLASIERDLRALTQATSPR